MYIWKAEDRREARGPGKGVVFFQLHKIQELHLEFQCKHADEKVSQQFVY